jgi:hypothetical protein
MTDRQLSDSGLATSLVTALDDDTVRRAQPLPLDAVIPWKSLALTSLAAAALGLGLALASALSWEWRAAAGRAFLGEQPYTEIFVEPGDVVVKEGESLAIQIKVRGRTGGRVSFLSRRPDEDAGPWRDEPLPLDKAHGTADREASFEVLLDRIRHPLEYRISAGTTESEVYQVKVLHPLKIVRQQATIEPPAYTRQQASTIEQGDITALIGSHLQLNIELDRAPESAWLEMRALARRFPGEEPPIERLPLTIEGTSLSAELGLTSDQTYSIVTKSADGVRIIPLFPPSSSNDRPRRFATTWATVAGALVAASPSGSGVGRVNIARVSACEASGVNPGVGSGRSHTRRSRPGAGSAR